jgi:KaiC/GvpD/RAD55 family RecA-like ATPase
MISASALGQALLALLVHSEDHAGFLAEEVDHRLFHGKINQKIARVSIDYIKQYGRPPGDQIELLLEVDISRGEEGKLLFQTIEGLPEQFKALQPDFVLAELDSWRKIQQITKAAEDAIEAACRGDLPAAEKAMDSRPVAINDAKTSIWFQSPEVFRASDNADLEFFSSGVEAIDNLGCRPERKTITCWIAPTGRGKTWALLNTMKAAIQHHHSVLYISLEVSAEKIAQRLLQAVFALSKKEGQNVKIARMKETNLGAAEMEFSEYFREGLEQNRYKIMKKLMGVKSWPKVLIQQYPTGQLSYSRLCHELDNLEKKGFKPDVLIIDAPHNMALNTKELRLELGRLWVNLRGLSVERNFVVVGASQGNKASDTVKMVDRSHVAEDWSIVGTCDAVYTFSQTAQEYALGISRLLVAKYRDESDRGLIMNSQCYAIGQFSIYSTLMAKGVAAELERMTGGE